MAWPRSAGRDLGAADVLGQAWESDHRRHASARADDRRCRTAHPHSAGRWAASPLSAPRYWLSSPCRNAGRISREIVAPSVGGLLVITGKVMTVTVDDPETAAGLLNQLIVRSGPGEGGADALE